MPLFAINRAMLEFFNQILHDLYYEIPRTGLSPSHGKLQIILSDRDHVIDKISIYRFLLTIHNTFAIENIGRWEDLPGGDVELNRID